MLFFTLYAEQDYQKLLDTISKHAIEIGTGPNRTYAFIDPLCQKSRHFLELLDDRHDLQEKSTYYIFLYRLQKYHSEKHIQYIYQSSDPLHSLKEIMLYGDYDLLDGFTPQQETLSIVDSIAKIAKEMKIRRRPYLLIFEKGSSYCQVSDGTAPCMEDDDFNE